MANDLSSTYPKGIQSMNGGNHTVNFHPDKAAARPRENGPARKRLLTCNRPFTIEVDCHLPPIILSLSGWMLGPLAGGGLLLEFSGACGGGGPPKFPPGRPPGGPVPLGGKGGTPVPAGPPPGGPPGGKGGGPLVFIIKCKSMAIVNTYHRGRRPFREEASREEMGEPQEVELGIEVGLLCSVKNQSFKRIYTHVHQILEEAEGLRSPWGAEQTLAGDHQDVGAQNRSHLVAVLHQFHMPR